MPANISLPTDLHANLYDAQKLSEKIEAELIEFGGEITEHLEALIAFKDYTENALADNIDAVAMTIDRIENTLEYYTKQESAITTIMVGLYKTKEKLLYNLEQEMLRLNLDEVSGLNKRIAFKLNPPKVDVFNESLISDDFKKITLTEAIDKKKIAETIKTGIDVPGCRLIQNRSLSIKHARPSITKKESLK